MSRFFFRETENRIMEECMARIYGINRSVFNRPLTHEQLRKEIEQNDELKQYEQELKEKMKQKYPELYTTPSFAL